MTDKQFPEIIIADLAKNNREIVRVSLGEYEGTPTIGAWRYYRDASGTMRPGKGGLILGIRHLPALAAALAKALEAARDGGRLPPA